MFMKKPLFKVLAFSVVLIMMFSCLTVATYAATTTGVNITPGTDTSAYTWNHIEYTSINNVRGLSEANAAHYFGTTDEVEMYAWVSNFAYNGNSYSVNLNVEAVRTSNSATTQLYTESATSRIEWQDYLSFSRGYSTNICANETAFYNSSTGTDSWSSRYSYQWRYSDTVGGFTFTRVEYTSYD